MGKTNLGAKIGVALLAAGLVAALFLADWRFAVAGAIGFIAAGLIGAS